MILQALDTVVVRDILGGGFRVFQFGGSAISFQKGSGSKCYWSAKAATSSRILITQPRPHTRPSSRTEAFQCGHFQPLKASSRCHRRSGLASFLRRPVACGETPVRQVRPSRQHRPLGPRLRAARGLRGSSQPPGRIRPPKSRHVWLSVMWSSRLSSTKS